MANSANKAEALKNSYVSSIIDEFGKGNLPKATGIEPLAQETASVHLSPNTGEIGGINDNDPGSYIHYDDGTTIKGPSKPEFANPVEGAPGSGAYEVDKMDPGLQKKMNHQDKLRRGITTGDMAGISPGLAGKLGMQVGGDQASMVIDARTLNARGVNDGRDQIDIINTGRGTARRSNKDLQQAGIRIDARNPVSGQGQYGTSSVNLGGTRVGGWAASEAAEHRDWAAGEDRRRERQRRSQAAVGMYNAAQQNFQRQQLNNNLNQLNNYLRFGY